MYYCIPSNVSTSTLDFNDPLNSPVTIDHKAELSSLPVRARCGWVMWSRLESAFAEGFSKELVGWVIYIDNFSQYIQPSIVLLLSQVYTYSRPQSC